MDKKQFSNLTITLTTIFLIIICLAVTLANKDDSPYLAFKNYFQEKIIQFSEDKTSQLKDFEKLSPTDKFVQASKLPQDQDKSKDIDSAEVNGNE